jgi:hypothetical protein
MAKGNSVATTTKKNTLVNTSALRRMAKRKSRHTTVKNMFMLAASTR